MVIVPRPETVEGKMLTVLDEHGRSWAERTSRTSAWQRA
jgi:hypothetical protein